MTGTIKLVMSIFPPGTHPKGAPTNTTYICRVEPDAPLPSGTALNKYLCLIDLTNMKVAKRTLRHRSREIRVAFRLQTPNPDIVGANYSFCFMKDCFVQKGLSDQYSDFHTADNSTKFDFQYNNNWHDDAPSSLFGVKYRVVQTIQSGPLPPIDEIWDPMVINTPHE